MFIIMNLNPVKVRVGVPEAEIWRVKRGQQAAVLIPSLGEKKFNGRVETVGIAADPMSRTFAVKISVPNPVLELRAGMIAESRIQAQGVVRAMTVPAQAVVRDPQGAVTVFVFFADRKRVYSRRVDVGTVYDREIEVVRGLEGEELVVVSGQQGLVEGSLAPPIRFSAKRRLPMAEAHHAAKGISRRRDPGHPSASSQDARVKD